MSLQGSLETFALPDVLVLLSSTKKDGELRVVGGRVDGRIWLEKGQLVHANVGGRERPFVDALFELLRLEVGTFNFEAGSAAPHRAEPQMIDLVLADAQVRLGEWNEIARVVPHLDAVIDMAEHAPGQEVTVSRDQWQLLRSVAGGRSVHDLMDSLGRTEFDTCKSVKELVDAKLASIDVDAKPRRKAETAPEAAAPAPVVEAEAADPEPAPEAKASPPKLDPSERAGATDPLVPVKTAPKPDVQTTEAAPAKSELDALAELASQPRKVRATTSTDGAPSANGARPAAVKTNAATQPVEEAKALVAQLAALSGDDEEAVAAKVTEHLASGGELPDVVDGDEPINRGLLLKFLSSVRN